MAGEHDITIVRDLYEGPLEIWKNGNLLPIEQVIEHHFADYLQRNLDQARTDYQTENGNVLDTDRARSLSSVWNLSNLSRAVCSSAVHYPASAFINDMYQRLLKGGAGNIAIFTAGGGGSGKSAAMERFAGRLAREASLIYDTTLSNLDAAIEKIETALSLGKSIFIIYVYRPFPEAVRGVIYRAMLSGRTVPLSVLAKDHAEAPRSVLQIAKRYAANDNVQVIVLDNSGEDVSEIKELPSREEALSFLENVAYNTDTDAFVRTAKGVLEDEASKGYIPEYIIDALDRDYQRRKVA